MNDQNDKRPAPDDYLTTRRGQEALSFHLDKLFGARPRLDPTTVAVEVLKRELPGFEAGISSARETITVQWRMKLGAELGLEALLYAAPRDERDVYVLIRPIIEEARRHAVRDFGLDAVMREREVDAFERGRTAGYAEGRSAGISLGRKEMLAEILAVREDEGEGE